jgi:hypothetical protein
VLVPFLSICPPKLSPLAPRRYPPPPAPIPIAAPVPACHYSAIAPSPAVRPLARRGGEAPMPTHFCRHLQPPVCLLPPLRRPVPTVSVICLSANRGTLLPLSSLRLPLFTYSLFLLRCSPCPRLPQIPCRCRRWHRSGLCEDNHRSLQLQH